MDFAVILIATIVGCFALRNPLKALPVAFYAAAIAIDVVYVYGVFFGLPRAIWSPLFVLIPVSYTHLDVYKRQLLGSSALQTVIDGRVETMQPSVFVDKLERAGALVWKEGWTLTEEGREFLEDLKVNGQA